MLVASLGTYLLLFAAGDPAAVIAGETASDERIEEVREEFGLDQPILAQYGDWLSDAVRGDLGESFRSGREVSTLIAERLPATVSIAIQAMILATVFSVIAGVVAGMKPKGRLDSVLNGLSLLGMAIPNFVVGIFLVIAFATLLPVLPSGGYRSVENGVSIWFSHTILPASALAVGLLAQQTRTIRASVTKVTHLDYIRTARAKGLPESSVVIRHVVPNALLPVVTVVGLQIGRAFTGAILVEAVFAVPGVGRMMVDAVTGQDFPVVQGLVIFFAMIILGANLLVDVSYGWLSPVTIESDK